MEQNENRRIKMTKLLLQQSLIELMHSKSIHQITVKELCNKADINRSTFYKHYETVYALYSDILANVNADIEVLIGDSRTDDNILYSHKTIEKILNYIYEKKELFLVLLSNNSNIGIGESIINVTDNFIDREKTTEFSRYCTQFVTAGMTSIIWMWLNDENRHTAHDIAVLLYTLLGYGLKRAISFANREQN